MKKLIAIVVATATMVRGGVFFDAIEYIARVKAYEDNSRKPTFKIFCPKNANSGFKNLAQMPAGADLGGGFGSGQRSKCGQI